MYRNYYMSEIGEIELREDDGKLIFLEFRKDLNNKDMTNFKDTKLFSHVKKELDEYFSGKLKVFSVPYKFSYGTDFMRKCWDELVKVPYGHTSTYKDVAIGAGSPKAVRAVGMANNRNPISIVVPCHRIIGSNGKLVGYGGGLDKKEWLIEHEKKYL